jgi:HD-like signal output (HDOD) protein
LHTLLQDIGIDHSEISLDLTPSTVASNSTGLDPQLATIFEMATAFDNELEFSGYMDVPLPYDFETREYDAFENPAYSFVISTLRPLSKADLVNIAPKLPVFPRIGLDALRAVRGSEVTTAEIVGIASKDQVLAGNLLACANSAAHGRRREVTNLAHAVAYIGTHRAAMILMALVLKPLLVTPRLAELWGHSIEAASAAETMSSLCEDLSRSDAYVLGLIHDIGRLLLDLVPGRAAAARDRLIKNGCEIAVAELLTCGADHAEAGALVLDHWGLPDRYIEAVRFHHQPQVTDSKLASLLYLVEFWTDSCEDPASTMRLRAALDRLDLSVQDVLHMRPEKSLLI